MKSFYKVFFKGNQSLEDLELSLTFSKLNFNPNLSIPTNLLEILKKLGQNDKNIIVFENISEVIDTGDSRTGGIISNYKIILYKDKEDHKEGLLIANTEENKESIIGMWPFNESDSITKSRMLDRVKSLEQKPNEYRKISLIN